MTAIPSGLCSAFVQKSALLAGLLAAAFVSPVSAAVTANIVASRTSGVAPLAVSFDATGTTSTATTRPFHDVYYVWNYGDPGSGTWSINGKSKNRDTGAIGGHVFETPGTYTVTLTAKDTTGAVDTETVTITVSDPNIVFSGTNTVCISTSGNFTGAPAGAATVTTSSWATVVAQLGAGKRVLLRRGETWNHNGVKKNLSFAGPVTLGAFGTGNRPILRLTSSNTSATGRVFWLTDKSPVPLQDLRIMDLEIDGDGFDRGFALAEGSAHNITFLRVFMHDAGPLLFLAPSTAAYYNNQDDTDYHGHVLSSGIALVDTEFQNMVGDGEAFNQHHVVYLGLHRSLLLGNVWNNAELGEHILRLPFVQRTLVAHNRYTNARATKHLIKLHASSDAETLLPPGEGQSKFVTIADNTFSCRLGSWLISTGPQDARYPEVVQDIVIERNHVAFGSPGTIAFDLRGSDHTVRNNTVVMDGSTQSGTMVNIDRRGVEPAPTDNRIYNNSAYRGDTDNFTLVNVAAVASNTTVRNNLGSAPNSGTKTTIAGGGTNLVASHNVITNTPGWVVSSPSAAAHFDLLPTSSAVNAGTTVPVFDDFDELPRPQGSAYDLGAFELLGNLLSHAAFEPDQATTLADQANPYIVGTHALNKWHGRLGSGGQHTTYQTSGSNHYVTVGTSANTNGCFQVIVWPGSGTRTLSYQYRGTAPYVRIYGGSSGATINKFDGANTLTLLTQINNTSASGWTTHTQSITLSGSHSYLVIQLRAGDFDNLSLQ